MSRYRNLERPWLVCALLVLATLAAYVPVVWLDFVNLDDDVYVTLNPHVSGGLTLAGLRWAFSHCHAANWHPLTWLSHMFDCQFFGLNPAGHHAVNLLFHAANTLLLFLWLRSLTGAFWRSALVAALFALHPLRVESVAWVAERKDVLCAFFGLLSLWAYTSYARKSVVSSQWPAGNSQRATEHGLRATDYGLQTTAAASRFGFHVSHFYLLSLFFLALGLMSKPMLVTWPFVMLLLDYWPLRRFGVHSPQSTVHGPRSTARKSQIVNRIFIEKVPFFVLSAASCVVTVWAQRAGGAVASLHALPLGARLGNALAAYSKYLWKLVWPTDLAVLYGSPGVRPMTAAILLVAVTLLVLWQRKRWPDLLVGWAWYVGTLVPVIGLVQVGSQAMADRYTYLPAIGLFIALAWSAGRLAGHGQALRWTIVSGASAALLACTFLTGSQLLYWQTSETLFRRALSVTKDNPIAWNNLGGFLGQHGQPRQAELCYRRALEIDPTMQEAWKNLGCVLMDMNRSDEAIRTYEAALQANPGFVSVHNPLATALAASGRLEEAKAQCREGARLDPHSAEPHSNLGALLAREGKWDEALDEFRKALALDPDITEARCGLAGALAETGHYEEAVRELRGFLEVQPSNTAARLQLGGILMKQGKLEEALAEYSGVLQANPTDATAYYRMALALNTKGQSKAAIAKYRAALERRPHFPEALNNLAWLLATHPDPQLRDGSEAVRLAEHACRLTEHRQAFMVGTLGAAYAEAGRFPEAAAAAEQAKALAEKANDSEVAAMNSKLLALYRSGQPYRDSR